MNRAMIYYLAAVETWLEIPNSKPVLPIEQIYKNGRATQRSSPVSGEGLSSAGRLG